MTLAIFGVRHHGTGCSRALVSALEDYAPDLLLVEGPPEGAVALNRVAAGGFTPPVALLIYPDEEPRRAAIYPFADFSPEWVAIRYATSLRTRIEFIDLPVANRYGLEDAVAKERAAAEGESDEDANEDAPELEDDGFEDDAVEGDAPRDPKAREAFELARAIREDPLGALARAAGELDPERWEERAIEQAARPGDIFPALLDAMTELRLAARDGTPDAESVAAEAEASASDAPTDEGAFDVERLRKLSRALAARSGGSGRDLEQLREAAMRRAIRSALKSGAERIAVVCGAWHAPALDLETTDARRRSLIPTKSADDATLAKLPKTKTSYSWIPWTFSRLSRRSGYGAGIESPKWLEELWRASPESRRLAELCGEEVERLDEGNAFGTASTRFLVGAARVLRREKLVAAAANVVDAARLADALAAIRERSIPSLDELRDAIVAVLCNGTPEFYSTIKKELEIGYELGEVPDDVPTPPLAKDVERERKSLRLKREERPRDVDLDLREESGRAKSRFFRRMTFIEAPCATPRADSRQAKGTFRETWTYAWKPEIDVMLVDASRYGSTLLEAASNMALAELAKARALSEIMALVERAIPAEIAESALDRVVTRLRNDAAAASDVNDALAAIPALARVLRYGAARGRGLDKLATVFEVLFERVAIRLREVCVNVADDAAREVAETFEALVGAIMTLDDKPRLERLLDAFEKLVDDDAVAKQVVGWTARALYERKRWTAETLGEKLGFFIGRSSEPTDVASWLSGFLLGTGRSILWLDALWRVFDKWLVGLSDEDFVALSPLLRRAFDEFDAGERRALAKTIAGLKNAPTSDETSSNGASWDAPNARKLVPILNFILSIDDTKEGEK